MNTDASSEPSLIAVRTTLGGVTASGGLLIALGGLLCFYVPFYLLILSVDLYRHFRHALNAPKENFLSLVLTILVCALLSYVTCKAGFALTRRQRWAANVAIGWGLLLLYFGERLYCHLDRPEPSLRVMREKIGD